MVRTSQQDQTWGWPDTGLALITTGARRRWTLQEKQWIVAESYSGPWPVSLTARRNGLCASQLFTWGRLSREGRLVEADEAAAFARAIRFDEQSAVIPKQLGGAENGDRPTSSSLKAASYGSTINGTEILGFTVAGIEALREIISYQP